MRRRIKLWRKRTAQGIFEEDEQALDAMSVLKMMQKGLASGKYYEVTLSEGYVDGKYQKDIELEAHSLTPDMPTAELTVIYEYLRFDFSKDGHNQAVMLDDYPASVESDQRYLIMVHEHDVLWEDGMAVDKSMAPGMEEENLMGEPFEQEEEFMEEDQQLEEEVVDEEGIGQDETAPAMDEGGTGLGV